MNRRKNICARNQEYLLCNFNMTEKKWLDFLRKTGPPLNNFGDNWNENNPAQGWCGGVTMALRLSGEVPHGYIPCRHKTDEHFYFINPSNKEVIDLTIYQFEDEYKFDYVEYKLTFMNVLSKSVSMLIEKLNLKICSLLFCTFEKNKTIYIKKTTKEQNLVFLREWGSKYKIILPENDSDLLNLKELDISNSGVEYIPSQIILLTKLQKLVIKNNPINELPDEFEDIESLEIFDYRNTPLIGTNPPVPKNVYGCVVDEETADLVCGNKPGSYFYPVYIFGSIENRLVVVQYRWAYDLIEQRKVVDDSKKLPSIYQLMKKNLKPEIIKKFGVLLNTKDKKAGVYFKPEDEIAIKEFIRKNWGWDPLLHVEDNQEMVERAAGILD